MKISCGWAAVIAALVIPIVTALVILYSDVQSLKISKANARTVSKLRIEVTKQMTRNTVAIESLDETLKEFIRRLNG